MDKRYETQEIRPNGAALLPFLVFVVIYLGAGMILQAQGVEMAFYQFPSVTAMFIAVLASFFMTKTKLEERFQVDFGIINANYALVAALESREVADYINKTYNGAVVSTVSEPGNGYDSSINYDNLAGQTIVVAATAKPHAEILEEAAKILKEKEITLDILVCDNYEEPNEMVVSGEADADYFQHEPFLEAYNEANGTSLTAAASIHSEPMGLYPGTRDSLEGVR